MNKDILILIGLVLLAFALSYFFIKRLNKKDKEFKNNFAKLEDYKFCFNVIQALNANVGKRVGVDKTDATKCRIKLLFDMGYVLTAPEDDKSVLLTNALQVHKIEYKNDRFIPSSNIKSF